MISSRLSHSAYRLRNPGSQGRLRLGVVLMAVAAALMVPGITGARPIRAQQAGATGSAVEGALFLLLPVSAKSVAMARAMSALEGPESIWWNPAGIAREDESRFQVHRGEDLAGEATSLSALFAGNPLGVLGVSYQLTDLGDIERRDAQGNTLGTLFIRNHTGIVSLASSLGGGVSAGVNVKLIQQRVTCRGQCDDPGVDATNVVFDAGVQWHGVLGLPLTLAGALVHAGSDVQFFNAEQADPLPTRVRLAAAYDVARHVTDNSDVRALISVELEDRWGDVGAPATYIGSEVSAGREEALYLRAGYVFGADLQVDGAAVGVGLRYGRVDLGIAKSLVTNAATGEADPAYLTLGFAF